MCLVSLIGEETSLAQDLYVTSHGTSNVLRYDGTTGAFAGVFTSGGPALAQPRQLRFGPDGELWVVSFQNANVLRYDGGTGAYMDTPIPTAMCGLDAPWALRFSEPAAPDGGNRLYVGSVSNAMASFAPVLRWSIAPVTCAGSLTCTTAVPMCPSGLRCGGPRGLEFTPDGDIWVGYNAAQSVIRYNSATGAVVAQVCSNTSIVGMCVRPATLPSGGGNLLACGSFAGTHKIIQIDTTANTASDFIVGNGLVFPADITYGPDGNIYVANASTNSVLRFNGATGAAMGTFVAAGSGGLSVPSGLTFGPVAGPTPPPLADYGDAPDGIEKCALPGLGMYPTVFGTINAATGRTAPYHLPTPAVGIDNVVLGASVTHEPAAFQPACDVFTPGCDAVDDGPLVLCLTPGCTSGYIVGGGAICPVDSSGDCFGPSPGPMPLGWWILSAVSGAFPLGPSFVNVSSDWDLSGTYGDNSPAWCLRDAPGPPPFGPALYATTMFPVVTVVKTPPMPPLPETWALGPFNNRFHVSDEPMLATFDGVTSFWDGSGRMGGYAFGETEDRKPMCDPAQYRDVPRYCGHSVGQVQVTLNPGDVTCSQSFIVQLSSASPPPPPPAPRPPAMIREFHLAGRPYQPNSRVLTEMMSMDLGGASPLGPVTVRERADKFSWGLITEIQANAGGQFISGRALFDMFIEIQTPQGVLDTGSIPVRMLSVSNINTIPPIGTTFQMQSNHPIPLFVRGTGQPAGFLCNATHTLIQNRPCCRADFNMSGQVSVQDIFDYLAAYFAGDPRADINDSGTLSVQDLFDFLAAYFVGCS
ncbi:MAG: hypothetical protein IT438_11330 [Phycisphaerales bacterium]|nr:hypothetical protein [Phycisphaerales bacterium]